MLVGKLTGTGSLKGTLSGTGSLIGTLSGGGVGHGIPSGGEPGQGLIKVSDTDYDVKWMSILPEDTASGSVASFPDGADDLPMGVVVDIDPVQDLHGYDNPWPAGGGNNKCSILIGEELFGDNVNATHSNSNGTLVVNCTSTNDSGVYSRGSGTLQPLIGRYSEPVTYSFDIKASAAGNVNVGYQGAGAKNVAATTAWQRVTINITATGTNMAFVVYNRSGSALTIEVKDFMFQTGTIASANYEPYSNICPISGWTGAKVTRTGMNLLDESSVVSRPDNQYFLVDLKQNTDYIFSTDSIITGLYVQYSDADTRPDIFGTWTTLFNRYTTTYLSFNSGSHKWYRLMSYEINGNTAGRKFQLEPGSTVHAYEPYTAVTHEIPFSTEVYGGTLNVETGELVVTHNTYVWDGSIAWTLQNGVFVQNKAGIRYREASDRNDKIVTSSMFKSGGLGYRSECGDGEIIKVRGTNTQIACYSSAFATVADFNAYLTQNPMTICYELATPITLTLDPVEIRSLLGDNNVFADTGDVSVTYKADIQKYIDKKISAAVAAMS